MKQPDVALRLLHMRDFCRKAAKHLLGRTREDLVRDEVFSLAMTRLVEVIGEAAAQIPRDEQRRFPTVPWAEVVSMRNRLIHGYDSIDNEILWVTITQDLPVLASILEGIDLPESE